MMMDKELIKAIAVRSGFKLKGVNAEGKEDLHPYVYEFAQRLADAALSQQAEAEPVDIRDILFRNMTGCSNGDCIVEDRTKGMRTNGSCGCLHNFSRAQLHLLKSRISALIGKEFYTAPQPAQVPNEYGKNRYGLDMAYFRNLFNRELNRPLTDFRPDELARVLARAARTADAAVLQEAEFNQPAQVPEAIDIDPLWHTKRKIRAKGWNECRESMLSAATQLQGPQIPPATPDDIFSRGISVVVHNDYRVSGDKHTLWLFTDADSVNWQGEGKNVYEALDAIRMQLTAPQVQEGEA